MRKFQAIIHFYIDDEFGSLLPEHRKYINKLITDGAVDSYAVSMESHTIWITMNAVSKRDAEKKIKASALISYFTYSIEELFVYDGKLFRFPTVQLN